MANVNLRTDHSFYLIKMCFVTANIRSTFLQRGCTQRAMRAKQFGSSKMNWIGLFQMNCPLETIQSFYKCV